MAHPKKLPKKKDLTQGNTLEIHNREGKVIGIATLIRRRPSHFIQDGLPYSSKEKKNRKFDDTLSIWSFERWELEWVEHPYYRKGDRTCTEVHYHIENCINFNSMSDPIHADQETSGRLIFLEEPGVLSLGGLYQDHAFLALKAVKKKFRGELVLYTHTKLSLQEQLDIHDMRVLTFLGTDVTYQEALNTYLYDMKDDIEDFMIISGDSSVRGLPNTIQCGLRGLKRK